MPIVGKRILEKSFYFVNVNTCDTWLERNVGPSTDGAVVLLEGTFCHRIPCILPPLQRTASGTSLIVSLMVL